MASILFLEEEPIGPRLSARLYRDHRGSPRAASDRGVTLRSSANVPIDAIVENFSQTGFAMSTDADFGIGAVIGLSIGGTLRRRARVVRRLGLAYGCEFLSPLSDLEVSAALRSGEVVEADFSNRVAASIDTTDFAQRPPRKLSYLARAYVVGGLIIAIWAFLIAVTLRLF